jgi:hypothetical protein
MSGAIRGLRTAGASALGVVTAVASVLAVSTRAACELAKIRAKMSKTGTYSCDEEHV